jgi:hypothetical protein
MSLDLAEDGVHPGKQLDRSKSIAAALWPSNSPNGVFEGLPSVCGLKPGTTLLPPLRTSLAKVVMRFSASQRVRPTHQLLAQAERVRARDCALKANPSPPHFGKCAYGPLS